LPVLPKTPCFECKVDLSSKHVSIGAIIVGFLRIPYVVFALIGPLPRREGLMKAQSMSKTFMI